MLVVAAGAALDRLGAVIAAVHAEELFAFAIEAGDGAADLRHPPPAGLVVVGEVGGILREAFAGGGEDGAVLPDGVGDVLGVLEVEGILREVRKTITKLADGIVVFNVQKSIKNKIMRLEIVARFSRNEKLEDMMEVISSIDGVRSIKIE